MPLRNRMAAAAVAPIWARAPAPSVTLTASASTRSGSAFFSRSSGSHEAGGTTSAVIMNLPARKRRSKADAGGVASGIGSWGSVRWGRAGRAAAVAAVLIADISPRVMRRSCRRPSWTGSRPLAKKHWKDW